MVPILEVPLGTRGVSNARQGRSRPAPKLFLATRYVAKKGIAMRPTTKQRDSKTGRSRLAAKAIALAVAATTVVSVLGLSSAQASPTETASPETARTVFPVGARESLDAERASAPARQVGADESVATAGGAALPKKQVDAQPLGHAARITLPTSVDLSPYSVPVMNQGSVGSCVAWAIDYAMLGWYSRHDNKAGQPFNPMYTYSQIHLDNSASGGGSYPSAALKIAVNQGNDTMAHYSHSTTDFMSLPNASEQANAASFKIAGWQTLFANTSGQGSGVAGETAIQQALAAGKPVVLGLPIRPGFDNLTRTAYIDYDYSKLGRGGHEVMATGYDANGVWIQNSWGSNWGYGGYGELSWDVVGADVFQAHTISGFAGGTTITTDTTGPSMSAVTERFALGQQITSSTTPVAFSWSATDTSGVAAYSVALKTDSGQFVTDVSVPASSTQVTYNLPTGHTYQVAVAAKDGAGNWSASVASPSVGASVFDDRNFSTGTSWGRYNLTDSYGGTYLASKTAGSWLQYTFTGRDAAVVGPKFSNAGKATLYCDGVSQGVIDELNASTIGRLVVGRCHFAQGGQHVVKIVVDGTTGRPWFGVDAFAAIA